jgi:glucose/arabinose dehydrogenase
VSFSAATEHLVSPKEPLLVKTGPFQPFGKTSSKIEGRVKANGTILRVNPDGSGLEVYAWGLRNPFGVAFGPDGRLYATENGYDERGSRPIANAPDCIWVINQGAFYGFPDFAGGVPVTNPEFRSSRGPEPKPLLKEHPPVEKPLRRLPPHTAATKIDFARAAAFGFEGQMFFGEVGGAAPINNPKSTNAGYQVARLDLASGAEPARSFGLRQEALGQAGYEHTVTPGPRRPIDVKFSPDGSTLYIVDFGGLAAFPAGAGPLAHPYPGSGVVWRVYRSDAKPWGPPPNLSPAPPLEQ